MQVTKGGFFGKTCVIAKLNDSSGGKKSKRRSKEERKEMVETFVKRHQASNNGNFPSLYLTHKEVGGSYYTVREIFRELIQENRVLAPPKLPPGEQNMENLDSFLENYPLGSISFDPNVHGLPPKDNQKLVNEYESRRAKVFNSKMISETCRPDLDNDDLVNQSMHATMKNEEVVDTEHMELLKEHEDDIQAAEPCEGQKRHFTEDVVVETFPLRPVFSMVDTVDEKTNEQEVLDGGEVKAETGNSSNAVVDTKLEEELLTTLQESAFESIHIDNNNSSSSLQNSAFKETTTDKDESERQPSGSIRSQTADATLNRINFDSCEATAASQQSVSSQETHPILSLMKTIVAAFVKLWSK